MVFLALIPVLSAGCIKRGEATLITTKPVDLDLTAGPRVIGEDCVWSFIVIPLSGKFYPSFKDAVENEPLPLSINFTKSNHVIFVDPCI